MERISEARAIELAKAFVAEAGIEHCGDVRHCSHLPFDFLNRAGATSKKSKSGFYTVAFSYTGPPFPPELSGLCSPPGHDVPITVDDVTGKCELMYKL